MKNKDMTIEDAVKELIGLSPVKIIISNVITKTQEIKKIQIEKKEKYYQIAEFTEKQVFYKNVDEKEMERVCVASLNENFLQLNAWAVSSEAQVKLTRKRKVFFDVKKADNKKMAEEVKTNNRKKNYILEEGSVIEPLVDMGIFNKEGKIVNSMYDKYKQINRFIEIIDDELKKR